ncbi:MAG: hypothetical protein Q9187_007316, partial [Circinaria calcarea]
ITTLLTSAIDIIDRLYKTATKIRNPAIRLVSSKAAAFTHIDGETGIDLIQSYLDIDYRHVTELFWEYRSVKLKDPENAPEEQRDLDHKPRFLTEEEQQLLSRLAKANTYRRKQFGYWARHRAKNAKETAKALEERIDTGATARPEREGVSKSSKLSIIPSSKAFSKPSTASFLQNPENIRFDDTASTISRQSGRSVAPQAQSVNDERVEIPEPPSALKDAKHFSCPYCFVLCSRVGDQMYDNWRDWATHEQWIHNRAWRCVQHPTETYLTALDFRTHLAQQHEQEPSLDLDDAVAAGATVSGVQDRPCPLCLYIPETGDAMQMQIHIASHLQRVALFALPNSTGLEDSSDAGQGSSKSANAEVQDLRRDDFEQVAWNDEKEDGLIQEASSNPLTTEALENIPGLSEASENSTMLRESISRLLNPIDITAASVLSKSVDKITTEVNAAEFDHPLRKEAKLNRLKKSPDRDTNAHGGEHTSALITASYSGKKEIVQLLLDNGADINAQRGHRGSALIEASRSGKKEIVQLLLDNGADINAQGGHRGSALIEASRSRQKEIVQLLLDKGADINAQGGYYGSALIEASRSGEKEIVQLLLDKGADINSQGNFYSNALIAASRLGNKEIVQLLLNNGADINAQGGEFGSALIAALYSGQKEIMQLLLDNGADVNAQGGHYGSALIAASRLGEKEIVQLLLDKGADINAQGGRYGSALTAASQSGKKEIVQLLLNNGAEINAQGGKFGSALMAASQSGKKEIVQLLLNNGAEINAQGGEFGSALMAASQSEEKEIVQLLLDNGAGGGSSENPITPSKA